jgi:hypothetical protein
MEATAASATAVAIGQGQQLRTSAYRGVGWCKRTGKFYASLRDKTRSQHLGYFATEDEAAQAYDARARQLRGVAARLNFPGEGERQGTAQQRVDPQAKAANVAAVATQQQRCTSAYRGVTWSKEYGQWRAQIWHQGRTQHLGRFNDEGEAARAYDARARQLHGVAARLNFPRHCTASIIMLWWHVRLTITTALRLLRAPHGELLWYDIMGHINEGRSCHIY